LLLANALNDTDGTRTVGTAYAITISIIANSPIANAIYESDDCFVVVEMESETEAWGIGKAIERFIQVTEDGDVEHLAAPGETLMEVYSLNQCLQVQVPLRTHRKSFFINPSTPGLSLVQSQVERRAGAMQSISAIAGTQQERRPYSHRLLQHGPLEQAQETRKTSMFSLQQQRWRSCALFLIATGDTSAKTRSPWRR
jgi:hypothetical protein